MSNGDKVREIVTDVTGVEWPAANVGKLRAVANAWRKFADDMENIAAASNKAAQTLIHNNTGEAISAFADPFWSRYYREKVGWLRDLVDGPRSLADGIDKYADAVADAKKKLDRELEIAGAVIVAGTALAFFTLGATEVAAAAATTAIIEVAATAGVALTAEVAALAGTVFATAAIAGIESVTVDLAVAQPLKIATGIQGGFSLDEASHAIADGMTYGGMFGALGVGSQAAAEAGGWRNFSSGGIPGVGLPRLTLADLAYGSTEPPLTPDNMGTRRNQWLRNRENSTVAVAPKLAPNSYLSTGDAVYYRNGSTGIGYDSSTMVNLDLVAPKSGYHDVVIHGNNQGYFEPGRVNAAGNGFSAGNTNATHIVEAIRNNPTYDGGPVRLISCHTGTVGDGVSEVPAAQSVANQLGVPVMAPTDKVGVRALGGSGQTPKIYGDGYWRTFLPVTQQ
ncbi:hypothetical protein [Streptomyces sp. NPDC058279]|uniref:WXG100-like domain-containing protein n=1 Tax=Streptomyces sp. NPDC058279 TaxID=3346418 RepID=UPI0036E75016